MVHKAIKSPVAGLVPLRDVSGQVSTRPKIIKSHEAAYIEQLRHNFRCIFGKFALLLEVLRWYLVVVDGGVCDLFAGWCVAIGRSQLVIGLEALLEKSIHFPSDHTDFAPRWLSRAATNKFGLLRSSTAGYQWQGILQTLICLLA